MINKLSIVGGSRKFCTFMIGIILILVLRLIYQFALIALSNAEGNEKVKKLVHDQENIALILVGVGTFLAGRRVILKWLDDNVNPDVQLTDLSLPIF